MRDPTRATESPDRSRIVMMVLIFLASLTVFFLGSKATISVYDEGVILTGALRVMDGEQPAANFYVNYGPAQFYIVAWIFELFGPSVTVGRIYDSANLAAVVCAAYWVARDLELRKSILAAFALIVLFLLLNRSPLYPVTPIIALLLLGCGLTIRALKSGGGVSGFLPLGAVIAAITLFRIDFGLISIAAFGTAVLVTLFMRVRAGSERFSRAAATMLGVVLITALAFAVTLAALYLAGFLGPAVHDLVTYNGRNFAEMRNIPFPSLAKALSHPLDGIAIYLPFLATLLGGVACVFANRAGSGAERHTVPLIVLCSATLFFYTHALVRTDRYHTLISDIPAIIVFFLAIRLFSATAFPWPWFGIGLRLLKGMVVVIVMLFGLAELSQRDLVYSHLGAQRDTTLPAAKLFSTDAERVAAARYVIKITEADDRILSATGRHDKIFVNDIAFYFLVGRLPGTRWHQYDPGVQTSEAVQREMISELEANDVKIIVENTTWDLMMEPNRSALSSGVTLLDSYIERNFQKDRQFGAITILRRRD